MKGLKGFVKDVGTSVQKIGAKPTTNDDVFNELKNRFDGYKRCCEAIKANSDRLASSLKDVGKNYTALGVELDTFFAFEGTPDGTRFKNSSENFSKATNDVAVGLGLISSGIEVIINQNEGLKKRIAHRHDLCIDMDFAFKDKDKDSKSETKYKEARIKYEEVNDKLITDLRQHLNEQHGDFQRHYKNFVQAQRDSFALMAQQAQSL
eukprot:TRINITY_DN430_c0_g1_i2.p1 TRINITY_DN430_c0_g1~~TRINITY_DN430_c0_g1_i2.p1  ORF type:complete len:207 (-),score=79.84 TRINITY_DN430_c0_g1_i2:139-759(-)